MFTPPLHVTLHSLGLRDHVRLSHVRVQPSLAPLQPGNRPDRVSLASEYVNEADLGKVTQVITLIGVH